MKLKGSELKQYLKTGCNMAYNSVQTELTEHLRDELSQELVGELYMLIDSIPFLYNLTRLDRPKIDQTEKDENGLVKVDITNPHILTDMDYFRPSAINWEHYGQYTNLYPNAHPNSAYSRFWQEEARRCREGYTREDGEWIPGPYYFYLNYTPILKTKAEKGKHAGKHIVGLPDVYDGDYLLFHYIEQARQNGEHAGMLKKRGAGYQIPDSEKVITPDGLKRADEINIGDYLVDRQGNPTKVEDINEVGISDVYEIELLDGRKARCGKEHLWSIYNLTKQNKKELNVVSTEYIMEKGLYWLNKNNHKLYKYRIPETEAVSYVEKDLPIHPYLLGLLLGDGALSTDSIKISSHKTDYYIIDKIKNILGNDYTLYNYPDGDCNYYSIIYNDVYHNGFIRDNPLKTKLRELNLLVKGDKKFIPDIYKYASVDQRLELVRGLLDSDGSINQSGRIEFTNSCYQLIEDFTEISRSLGIKTKIGKVRKSSIKNIKGKDYNIKPSYRVYVNTNLPVFYLGRKLKRINRNIKRINHTPIISIKKLDYQENSRCFFVDNDEHLFLLHDYIPTHNSYKAGSGLARLFILGDSPDNKTNVTGFAIADQKEYLIKDGILNKFVSNVNWCADHTPWPRMKLKDSYDSMQWTMGYRNSEGLTKGIQNSVIGVTTQGDPDKARGKRGSYIFWEEWGKNPHLLKSWELARESVGEGSVSFGVMVGGGTGGTDNADFRGAEELFYQPVGYSIKALHNVYDKNAGDNSICGYFFGAYLNRLHCYDKNGNSDVIAALIEILDKRLKIKYGSSDTNTLVQHKAEMCITPQEAVLRREGNMFPVVDLKEQLANASVDMTKFISAHYIGHLKFTSDGKVDWDNKQLHPVIREFPIKDTLDRTGNVEIFEMPRKNSEGRVPANRYIAGIDPIDSDVSTYTNSLGSIFIFDLWTDRIVAEFTGRPQRAVDFYDQVLRLLKYYNAQANYENNIKGLFSYMERNNSLHYLCETPQILKDLELMRGGMYGNTARGTHANKAINSWARKLQADWMISPAYQAYSDDEDVELDEQGNPIEKLQLLNLNRIRSVGYLKEAIAWVDDLNCDRVSAMGMVMILREERLKHVEARRDEKVADIFNDKFFTRNQFGGFSKRNKHNPKFTMKDSLRYTTPLVNDVKFPK